MPEYNVGVELVDDYGRNRSMKFQTISSMATHVAAVTAVAGLIVDLEALSELRVVAYTVALRTIESDTVTSGANKDEGITLSIRKEDGFKAVLKVPGPLNSVINADGSVDITDALVTNYYNNFETAGGEFTLSDGEQAESGGLISGRLDV
ncbi:MAG: hypothetical protein V3W44_03765 [Dehalococcoidales bacterium]